MKNILLTFALIMLSSITASAQDEMAVSGEGMNLSLLALPLIPLILGIAFLIYSKTRKKK